MQTGRPDKIQILPVQQCLKPIKCFGQHVAGCEMIISTVCFFGGVFFGNCHVDVELRIKRNVIILVHDDEPCRFPHRPVMHLSLYTLHLFLRC